MLRLSPTGRLLLAAVGAPPGGPPARLDGAAPVSGPAPDAGGPATAYPHFRPSAHDLDRADRLALLSEAALLHGVGGYLAALLGRFGSGPRTLAALVPVLEEGRTLTRRARDDLVRLAAVLDAEGVPWVVLKGPAAARLHHLRAPAPSGALAFACSHPTGPGIPDRDSEAAPFPLRLYGDLDILIAPEMHTLVRDRLARLGARPLRVRAPSPAAHRPAPPTRGDETAPRTAGRPPRPMATADEPGQEAWQLPGGTILDLHWDLVHRPQARAWYRIPVARLLARRRRVTSGEVACPVLEVTDAVLHLALHAGLHGGWRLIWLKDIERAVRLEAPDWTVLVERARRWGTVDPVWLALARARRLLGAAVPRGALHRLQPSRAARLAALVLALATPAVPLCRPSGLARRLALAVRPDARPHLHRRPFPPGEELEGEVAGRCGNQGVE